MRRLLCFTLLASVLLVPGRAAAQTPTFMISGHGWGHGVGMAQYGAYGYAQHGWTYDQILAHYYQGTTLGQAPVSKIRVLLASGRTSVTVGSSGSFSVSDGAGTVVQIPAGTVTFGTNLKLTVGGESYLLASPLRFAPGKQPLAFSGPYRGAIVVTLASGKLVVVNQVGLEQYVDGVVAGEMPASWSPEALKAQAVASRSYALASRNSGGLFDVYSDTRSQVYGGILAEDPRTNAAVSATKRQVVLYNGKVATTFFSASSGGRTAAVQDAFPGSQPVPYLVSVDDPYDTISPYHNWGPLAFTADDLQQKLGNLVPADLQELDVNAGASGRVTTVTAFGAGGTSTTVSGADMRAKLGLRSTWFTIDTVGLTPSATRLVYGQAVKLRGVVHGAQTVSIEQRREGGNWTTLATVNPGVSGSFALTAKPRVTTQYRLRVSDLTSGPVRVLVAPSVTLRQAGAQIVRGELKPAVERVPVTIQRRTSLGWKDVATALTKDDGGFRARLSASGSYRARVDALPGLEPGFSETLDLSLG